MRHTHFGIFCDPETGVTLISEECPPSEATSQQLQPSRNVGHIREWRLGLLSLRSARSSGSIAAEQEDFEQHYSILRSSIRLKLLQFDKSEGLARRVRRM